MITAWPCPGAPDGEFAHGLDRGRRRRVLIVPPLFDEMHRGRHLLVSAMRALDAQGIDSMLPDLPGTGESLQALAAQSLFGWRSAMAAAARHFRATHVLAVRGGVLVFPNVLPGWVLDPVSGQAVLRQMLRARLMSLREAGQTASLAELLELGRNDGLVLAGYDLGAAMIAGLDAARPLDEGQRELRSAELGGQAPWLRAEAGDDAAAGTRLAGLMLADLIHEVGR